MHYFFNVKKGIPSKAGLSNQRQCSETKYFSHFASPHLHFVSNHQNDPLTRIHLRQVPLKSVNLSSKYAYLASTTPGKVEKTNSDKLSNFRWLILTEMNTTLSFVPPPVSTCKMRILARPNFRWCAERLQATKHNAVAVETLKILSIAARLKQCCLQC